MIRFTGILLALFLPFLSFAQKNKKPALLVYGNDIEAFSAALQSAKSGVATLWIVDQQTLVPSLTEKSITLSGQHNLDAGLWRSLLFATNPALPKNDSSARLLRTDTNPQLFKNGMERMVSGEPNLRMIKNQKITSLKRTGKRWDVVLADKAKYEVLSVVDLSARNELAALAGLSLTNTIELQEPDAYTLQDQRTILASGRLAEKTLSIPLNVFLQSQRDNYFQNPLGNKLKSASADDIPFRSAVGQTLGAMAAYCAFFKTDADQIDIRKFQDELLQYDAKIIPYEDIPVDDMHATGLQKFGLAGMLKGEFREGRYLFNGEDSVRFDEIKPVFNQLYSRSQIWFLDNGGDIIKWKDLLSLIKYVSQRGDELDKQIMQDWHKKLKFEGEYDSTKTVSKYQFAVIVDKYCKPFVVRTDQSGKIIR
ncbi:FAD-dependent oxidoreductase [Sphingobacterium spiritivorum]|uniref:FAD-dependent oxidoreductase n=1 Tax=Sphingobacterium spiritivorum TaxID=258 RepID=UPI001918AD75|nr:FAD-dependent oxidoreductase [Sphingobacterium spiritivorum]QQT27317.1 hypothetical protein I6J02_05545 [Sphingobacterium spiritivorum]